MLSSRDSVSAVLAGSSQSPKTMTTSSDHDHDHYDNDAPTHDQMDVDVDDLRQRGNHEFQQGNLDNALAFYTSAIHHSKPASSSYIVNLCNRSACYYQLEDYEHALEDAQMAWDSSRRSNVKAAYRLTKTYMALHQPTPAVKVLQTALTIPELSETELTTLKDLFQQATEQLHDPTTTTATTDHPHHHPSMELTIRGVSRPISIREFIKEPKTLGVGNFSEVIVVTHKETREVFALKVLEKKQAADLAKRQHPNVYNEIAMEKRVLLDRLPPNHTPRIIAMYHAFADFNNIYYLMELHNVNTDLWSCLKYQGKMVGAHPSMITKWIWQLIDALEFIHAHGIVHRDLKPENVLLNQRNHIVLLDFGTAKDLIQTDLNGPEFVGTPDFMSPEAVSGTSGGTTVTMTTTTPSGDLGGATHTADLWALGAMVYILHTGSCPFWSPSPYLTFLRIKRGLLPHDSWAMPPISHDDEDEDGNAAWDFCSRLMVAHDPAQRLGADCFHVSGGKVTVNKGYDVLRNHAYFHGMDKEEVDKSNVVASLQDLALRACANQAMKEVVDLDLCEEHPPGDGSRHDMMRLSLRQRHLVWHVLEKLKVFTGGDETRVLQRFFDNDIDYLKAKVRPTSWDFVGLTRMNDEEFKVPSQRGSEDPYAVKTDPDPTKVVVLRNPILGSFATEQDEKNRLKGFKNSISVINKSRPKAVVISAQQIPVKYWKLLARIRDSIPVVWCDGSVFYSFWLNGFQGLMIQKSGFNNGSSSTGAGDKKDDIEATLEMKWLREQLEQSRMAKHQVFAFCDCDPRELPELVLKRLARGRVLCLYGVTRDDVLDYTISYSPNEMTGNDDVSVKSTNSEEDQDDAHMMRVLASNKNGMEWLTVDEKERWWTSFEEIDMPGTTS